MPGPPPNPQSRKQSGPHAHTWLELPADGYTGPVPEWPLPDLLPDEMAMWARYWRKPQAQAWASIGMSDEVAVYVRAFLRGVGGNVAAISEARQWATLLGLTPTAMLRNRWRIRRELHAPTPAELAAAGPATVAKRRLKVVDSDALARG